MNDETTKEERHPMELFRYCPRCGSPRFVEHNTRSKRCESCGFTYYTNPRAATVAFILRGEGEGRELLVVRRGKEPAKGTLDLPGGFCDLWETGEEGVAREVTEETGLRVQRATYLFSLPNQYPYSGLVVHTMDLFFLCHVEEAHEVRAMDDAEDARWVALQDLRPELFGLKSVRRGVEKFLANFPIYIRYK